MRTLDKFFALIDEGNPFLNIDTDVEVWRKVEEFITITRPMGEIEVNPIILATEKLLLRAIISYLTEFQPEKERNFSTIAELLRATLEEVKNGVTALDDLFEWVKEKDEEAFCYQQYVSAKYIPENFQSAVICLLDKLTILEILEKEKRKQKDMHHDKIIIE